MHASSLSPRQLLLHAGGEVQAGAFRENIQLKLLGDPAESKKGAQWPLPSGTVLQFGEGDGAAAIRLTFACEPCAHGAAEAGVPLEELSQKWKERASRGILATALRSGTIRVGDAVQLVPDEVYAPLADEHPARVRMLLGKVPRGKVTSWERLAALAGAPTGFAMRGMPGLLKAAAARGAPAHRVLDSQWRGVPKHLPDQLELLEEEGVRFCERTGALLERRKAQWEPTHAELYLDERQ